ncbi:TonB-dependent receptor [Flammeovirgaceae bacterium SG7u.111]|nr:TonB-dependent receptor [Flammeovirgaceae bacterium SG7u.132]WPO35247.1 TonB-dependent receptor [Flammeovirgaceae bacterium SG7u.111]
METKTLSIKEKALQLNLDNRVYGSVAEIGAGQEVAANFFKAGGASGTVAKTMSAYDMAFSDAIYGPEESGRYVCEPRVMKMLDKEFKLCVRRLTHRADDTCFFAFANTVEVLNYARTNQGRGWAGLRFQLSPHSEPNDCVIHFKLRDNDMLLQQQAVGMVGINLIYACYYLNHNAEDLLNSLVDELMLHRIEIDFFRLTGPDFEDVDNRLFSLKLVKNGLTRAAMFGPDGSILQPSDVLYKKHILVLRGRFRPITWVNIDMMEAGLRHFKNDPEVDENKIITISELTLTDLKNTSGGVVDEKDFLDRVNILCSLGHNVMVSNYPEYYRLVNYLSRYTRKKKIGLLVGVHNIEQIFMEKYYKEVPGGILQALGAMFGENVKLYAYPTYRRTSMQVVKSDGAKIKPSLKLLYDYFMQNNKIEDLDDCNIGNLHIVSDNVLEMIKSGNDGWEKYMPEQVAEAIKTNCLFDYPCSVEYQKELEEKKKNPDIAQ